MWPRWWPRCTPETSRRWRDTTRSQSGASTPDPGVRRGDRRTRRSKRALGASISGAGPTAFALWPEPCRGAAGVAQGTRSAYERAGVAAQVRVARITCTACGSTPSPCSTLGAAPAPVLRCARCGAHAVRLTGEHVPGLRRPARGRPSGPRHARGRRGFHAPPGRGAGQRRLARDIVHPRAATPVTGARGEHGADPPPAPGATDVFKHEGMNPTGIAA